jgi:transcriptional regulator with GAF, ATPase, and Fis domain
MADSPPRPGFHPTDRLVGTAPAITALLAQIRHLATFDTVGNPRAPTVLLQGETGTAKGWWRASSTAAGHGLRAPSAR